MSPLKQIESSAERPEPTLKTWFYRFVGLQLVIHVGDSLHHLAQQPLSFGLPLMAKVVALSAVASLLFWCGQQCKEVKE